MSSEPANDASASSFLLDGKSGRFLRLSDPDRVLVGDFYRLVTFESMRDAEQCALDAGLNYLGRGGHYDLDAINAWCRSSSASSVDCNAFISAWNLLNDICLSIPWAIEPFRGGHYSVVYDKLFYGLNLFITTPEGRHWTPIWRESQVRTLRKVLIRTIFEFRRLLPPDF